MKLPIISVYLNTRKLASFTLVAFILGGALGSVFWNLGGVYVPSVNNPLTFGFMKQFTNYDEMKDYLQDKDFGGYGYSISRSGDILVFGDALSVTGVGFIGDSIELAGTGDLGATSAASAAEAVVLSVSARGFEVGAGMDFSGTNVQVEGVDEADIVKTDGEYIYLVKGRQLFIIKAYPVAEAGVVAKVAFDYNVENMYVNGDKLIVFSQVYPFYYYDGYEDLVVQDKEQTIIKVLDITDRANPETEREITMDGRYFNSRMIGEHVYFLVTNAIIMDDDYIDLPSVREGKKWSRIEPTDIWYPNITRGWLELNTISSLNINDPDIPLNSETFLLDEGTTLYVSMNNLYIISQRRHDESIVTKISIQEGAIEFKANGTFPGYVLNQFSMDEYQGVLRVATTGGNGGRRSGNNVYTLDEDMNIIGRLEKIAVGEEIYSARFMGDRAYLVTFKVTDPLFTIDLSDPSNPRVLGQLKIPGFSNYLHPYDENIIIGIGLETVEAKGGEFAWRQGIKISLFDVSDVSNPRELAKIQIGDRGSSTPAQWDHHAFLFSKARNLLVIPILEAQIDEADFAEEVPADWYGEYVNQGAYVFDISPEGIELRGTVTHIDDDSLLRSGFWFESEYMVERSLYIEDNLYTISQGRIKINDLSTLEELAVIEVQ